MMFAAPEDLRRAGRQRAFRTSLEILLLVGLLLVGIVLALSQASGQDKHWAITPIPATVTVKAPSRDLPPEIAALDFVSHK